MATDVQVYFCDPQSPWQRGSNENTNGLLRQPAEEGRSVSVHSIAIRRDGPASQRSARLNEQGSVDGLAGSNPARDIFLLRERECQRRSAAQWRGNPTITR